MHFSSLSFMGFIYRKMLYADAMNETITELTEICEPFCNPSNDLGYCDPPCLTFCSLFCPSQVPPPTPSISSTHQHPNKALITTLLVLSIIFVLACFIAAYIKFHSRRTTTRVSRNEETHDQFLDEDQFPVLDHPIWYINTIGLQPSVISAITVCKYVKGEGLVEGTECSVCLNEFQEDETLRLLPKCGHAFHVPCIDTWLRSHTNCPMCRAPIVSTTAVTATSSSSSFAGEENTEIVAADSGEQSRRELEVGNGEEEETESSSRCEDGIQTLRRSVSLDSSSAFKISQALCNVLAVNSDKNFSDNRNGREDEINIENVSKRIDGNQRLLRFMGSSFRRSSQIGTSGSLKRSISCSGKLFMSKYSSNQNPRLPL